MANSLTAMSPTYWSARMGYKLYKSNIFRSLASFEEQKNLTDGQTVDRPYRSNIVVENYTKGTALTAQDLTATSNTLTVDTIKAALMYVDNVDKIQNKYDAVNLWADEAAERLSNAIDAKFLYEVMNAADTIDDGDLGGTAGNGFTLTTANIVNVVAKINRKLDVNNVPRGAERFWAISPQIFDVLWQYIAGKESILGDKTAENSNIGRFGGLELFMTNNLTASARWTPADQPTTGATITINGVTFQLVTTIGSTPGNVLVVTNTATTLDNLVAYINSGGGTTTANYVAHTTDNQRIMQDWVAVDGTTYIEVRAKGASYMVVATSEALDVWTTTQQIQHSLAGRKKAIDCVIQQNPKVEMASTVSAGKWGMNILPLTLFGTKTFDQGTREILDVQVRSDAY